MADIIMAFGACIFLILFLFLLFNFFAFIFSLPTKNKYAAYEPKVSIIIPCLNEEKNIGKCLNSVFALDYPKKKIEIIVIDDGSTDNTLEVLKKIKKQHNKIRVFEYKKKKGEETRWHKPYLLNFGVKKASNNIILSIDADTIVDKNSLKRVVLPLQDKKVGATNGSLLVQNKKTFMGVFQSIEYSQLNLIRKNFSTLFGNVIWFFGAFACYKKDVIQKFGYFRGGKMGEDVNTNLSVYKEGYEIKNVHNAFVYTNVPTSIKGLFKQRIRWWGATLDSLSEHRSLFSIKSNASMLFLFLNHYWWSVYSLIVIPLIIYQIAYWLPYNQTNLMSVFMYLFRWFTLLGPLYVIYNIPNWGVSLYNIFGVMSGIISIFLIIAGIYMFNERLDFRKLIAIFFYFPYTLLINATIIVSVIKKIFLKNN